MSDNLSHFSFRLGIFSAIGRQFYQNFMTGHSPVFFSCGNVYIFQISLIIRPYKSEIFILFIYTHNSGNCMGNNPDYFTFFSLSAPGFYDYIFNLVALKRTVYILFGNKNIFLSIRRSYETKSPGIGLKASGKPLRSTAAVFSPLRNRNLSFFHQSVQHLPQLLSLFPRNLKQDSNLFYLHWNIKVVPHKVIYHFFSFFKCLIHKTYPPVFPSYEPENRARVPPAGHSRLKKTVRREKHSISA